MLTSGRPSALGMMSCDQLVVVSCLIVGDQLIVVVHQLIVVEEQTGTA